MGIVSISLPLVCRRSASSAASLHSIRSSVISLPCSELSASVITRVPLSSFMALSWGGCHRVANHSAADPADRGPAGPALGFLQAPWAAELGGVADRPGRYFLLGRRNGHFYGQE